MQKQIYWYYCKLFPNYYLINAEFLKISNNSSIKAYGKIYLNINGCLICICKISKQLTTAKKSNKSSKAYGIKEIGWPPTIWSIKLRLKYSQFNKETIPNKYSIILSPPYSTKSKIHAISKLLSNSFKTFTNIYLNIFGEKYSFMSICGNITVDIINKPKGKNFNSINFLFSRLLIFSNISSIFKKLEKIIY